MDYGLHLEQVLSSAFILVILIRRKKCCAINFGLVEQLKDSIRHRFDSQKDFQSLLNGSKKT